MKKVSIILIIMLILAFSFNTVFAAKYKGDMNGDNKRDIIDVRLLLQEYVNKDNKKSAEEIKVRDMNGDAVIDILDVRLLLQQYINKDPLEEIPPEVVAVKSVALNKTSLSLTVGESATLKATLSPTDATNKKVTWSSSDKTVATVSSSGKVTAVKAGNATITVKTADGNKTATCKVTVKEAVAPDIKIAVPSFKNKTYNGREQSIVASTGYSLSGTTKATNPGTYSVTAKLASGYTWSDGTTMDKTIKWKIVKANSSLTLESVNKDIIWETSKTGSEYTIPLNDLELNEKVSVQLSYKTSGDGTIEVSSSDKKIATIKNDATKKVLTITTIRPGNATITVNLKASSKYGATTIEINLISKLDNKQEYQYKYNGKKIYEYKNSNTHAWVEEINGCYVTKIWVKDPSKQLRKQDSNRMKGLFDDNPASSMKLKTVGGMVSEIADQRNSSSIQRKWI